MKNQSGQLEKQCRVLGCSRKDIVGAHVIKAKSNDNNWYIVPLCHTHNRTGLIVELNSDTKLVSTSISQTCDY